MKKTISTLLSALLIAGGTVGLAACGDGDGNGGDGGGGAYNYNITVWVGEDTKPLTESLITKFNNENTYGIHFNANVNEVTEGKAAGDVISKPGSAPEMFCFAQDQLARLVEINMLASPSNSVVRRIKDVHSDRAVNAVTMGETVYAYPLTEDNGYFLYYDKSVISETQADSIEDIIAQCEANNKYFSFGLEGAWYVASFFYGAGAKSEWTVNDQGKFTAYDDTFNSPEGMIAAKGMQKVLKSNRYIKNGLASDFNGATPAAAVISGIWDYSTAKNALKENLGIAKLPTFTVDGNTYRLKSYLGCKMLGVTPQTDPTKASALAYLAEYLTGEDAQMQRFTQFGWGPSVKTAQEKDEVKNNDVLTILKQTATIAQGQYPANWWAKPEAMSNSIKVATSDTAIQSALSKYSSELPGLLNAN